MANTSLYTFDDYSDESLLLNTRIDNQSLSFSKDVVTAVNQRHHITKRLIGDALKAHIDQVDADSCAVGDEDAFFVADLGQVYRQHLRWKKHLGRVIPHYGKLLSK
jgi:hypothetical protein